MIIIITAIVSVVTILISRTIIQPLSLLNNAMKDLSTSDNLKEIVIDQEDEIADIAVNFNKYILKII